MKADMDLAPTNALRWMRAVLLLAKFHVAALACLLKPFRSFSNDAQIALIISCLVAAVLLFIGGIVQWFMTDRHRASLNFVMGIFAVVVLACLLPVLTT
jgi:Na+/proline symporter